MDLMVDEVVAGAVLDEIPHDWRDALAAIARALRGVPGPPVDGHRGRAAGPDRAERHAPREQSLESTAALGIDRTKRLAILRAVDTYAMGHAHISPGRDQNEGKTANDPSWRAAAYLQGLGDSGNFPNLAAFGAAGLLHNDYGELTFETGLGRDPGEGNIADDPGWRAAAEAYLKGLADSGNFPNLAAFGAAGLLHHEYDELTFETGLGWLLTGIAADANQAGDGPAQGGPLSLPQSRPQAATSTARSRIPRGSGPVEPRRTTDPRTIQSGAKNRSGPAGKGNPYLKGVLGEAAAAAARTDTFLGERYRRIARRRGKLKALVAVARSILVIIWHLLADPAARYQDLAARSRLRPLFSGQ